MTAKTLDAHITMTPGIAGGRPRIAGRRITVEDIAIWHEQMGRSADEIATDYNLTLADVYAALAYYYDHQAEVDESIREGQRYVDEMRARTPSRLTQKLHGEQH